MKGRRIHFRPGWAEKESRAGTCAELEFMAVQAGAQNAAFLHEDHRGRAAYCCDCLVRELKMAKVPSGFAVSFK